MKRFVSSGLPLRLMRSGSRILWPIRIVGVFKDGRLLAFRGLRLPFRSPPPAPGILIAGCCQETPTAATVTPHQAGATRCDVSWAFACAVLPQLTSSPLEGPSAPAARAPLRALRLRSD